MHELQALLAERAELAVAMRALDERAAQLEDLYKRANRLALEAYNQWNDCNNRTITYAVEHMTEREV